MLLETIATARSQYSQEPIPEVLKFRAVAKNGSYPSDGSDEDNTYARFSPTASVEITIANPELIGKLAPLGRNLGR